MPEALALARARGIESRERCDIDCCVRIDVLIVIAMRIGTDIDALPSRWQNPNVNRPSFRDLAGMNAAGSGPYCELPSRSIFWCVVRGGSPLVWGDREAKLAEVASLTPSTSSKVVRPRRRLPKHKPYI